MEHKELSCLFEALTDNKLKAMVGGCLHTNEDTARDIAIAATIIDYLRGDICGLPSPLSDIARNSFLTPPKIPPENQDPNPLATECMKRLGELGVQSLFDVKGYKLDGCEHFLLHINGRFADTGWTNGDKRISVFMSIMDECGITLNRID